MKISTIIALVIGVVCVVTTIISVFGAGKLIKIAYDGLLNVPHNCYYYRPDGGCEEDKSQTRREVADSAAMVTVSLPLAIVSFRRLLKLRNSGGAN